MSITRTIIVHSIEDDGVPDNDDRALVGRTAFIWNGAVVSGWPLQRLGYTADVWEPSEDRFGGPVAGVTHWVELPVPAWRLEEQP